MVIKWWMWNASVVNYTPVKREHVLFPFVAVFFFQFFFLACVHEMSVVVSDTISSVWYTHACIFLCKGSTCQTIFFCVNSIHIFCEISLLTMVVSLNPTKEYNIFTELARQWGRNICTWASLWCFCWGQAACVSVNVSVVQLKCQLLLLV